MENKHTNKKINTSFPSLIPVFIVIACSVIILAGMKAMSDLVNMTMMAFLIAIFAMPFMRWLRKKGMKDSYALALTILAVVTAGIGLVLFLFVSMAKLATSLPTYFDNFDSKVSELRFFIETNFDVNAPFLNDTDKVKNLAEVAFSIVGSAVGIIATVGFTLFLVSYMLYESLGLKTKLQRNFKTRQDALNRLYKYGDDIQQYIIISAEMGALAAIADVLFFSLMGIDFALLWGILSFFMSFVPSLGFIIAAIPPTVMALVQYGWPHALVTFIGIWLINGTVDQLIKPKQMGDGLKVSPFVIFWSIMFWGFILGPVGGLLAVPLTVAFKTLVLEASKRTQWIGDLLSEK